MLIGCPVYNRGWILHRWFKAAQVLEPDGFVFAYTPSDDDTLEILQHWQKRADVTILVYDEGTHGTTREWNNRERIETLATARNLILDRVADTGQDYMSLDSDIILMGDSFILHLTEWDAVSPTVSLATDRTIINAFTHRRPDGWTVRAQPGWHGSVDVLCAAILMRAELVQDSGVRYSYHARGEDFAWSAAARQFDYSLGLCTDRAKHYMTRGRKAIVPPNPIEGHHIVRR